MGSYVAMEINGVLVPVKIGGYTGKTEPKVTLSSSDLKKLVTAIRNDDKQQISKYEKAVFAAAAKDIKTGYIAFPKKPYNVRKSMKTVKIVGPEGRKRMFDVMVKKWSRGGKAIWFVKKVNGNYEKYQPFIDYNISDIKKMMRYGYALFSTYTLSGEPRKRMKKASVLGHSGEIDVKNVEARKRRPGETKESKKRVLKDGTVQVYVEPTSKRKGYWRTVGKKM